MTKLYPGLYATPFHARTAARNIYNAWTDRGLFTVPAHFGNTAREALAARFSAVLADISPQGRLRVHGAGAERLLSSALKADLSELAAGRALDVFWTSDGGGVRGIGVLARYGEENFVLEAQDTDMEWFAAAAGVFGARLRDERPEKGVLLLAGPFAPAVLDAAGFVAAATLGPMEHCIVEWQGISLTVARRRAPARFEISCARDSGIAVFDRLALAGRPFALTLIGQEALELLYLESGVPLAGKDYAPTREISGDRPDPAALGLRPATEGERVLVGVELHDADRHAPAILYLGECEVGRTLHAAHSHALRRTIALANVDPAHAAAGTELLLGGAGATGEGKTIAKVVALPFLAL